MKRVKYRVELRKSSDRFCHVMATDAAEAALRGAIKLGVRSFGTRPTVAIPNVAGSSLHAIYAPLDGGLNNCNADVYVQPA